jgi:cell division control protein 6
MSIGFQRGDTPYKNRDALLDDYTPDKLVGRDAELEEYQSLLNPVIWGDQPPNIFLYGKAGVGKTAATKYMLRALENDAQQYDDLTLTTLHINCDGLESSYQVAVKIVNTLRDPRNQISESGYSSAEVYGKMWDEFDDCGGTILLVLDEVDHVRKDDSILYQLSRARENDNLNDARIGLIGISNDMTFRDRLSPKVRSSLCERELSFSDYDAIELQEVLQQRCEVAFKDDAVNEDVIPKCAAWAAQETGDAREALDYLLVAGDLARDRGEETVTEDHIDEAKESVERQTIIQGLADRGDQVKYVAYAVVTLHAEGETPARTNDVYRRYEQLVDRSSDRVLSKRWVREHLGSLAMLGIISEDEINEGAGGGQYKEYELTQELDMVLRALEDTIGYLGIHESVTDYV